MAWINTRGTRLSQPPGPVEVDWGNPLARGLVYVDPLFLAQNRLTGRNDIVVGTKLTTSTHGLMRGFGPTVGAGSGDSIETTLNTNYSQKTIFARVRRDGLGGGNLGRLFDKRVSSAEVESCLTTFSPANYLQYGVVFSGGSRLTYWPLPDAGKTISFVLTGDSTNTNGATAAQAFYDGVLQTVASSTSTSGTANTNTDNYVVGNRKNDNARNFDGLISDFMVWNRILTADEIREVSANPWQLFKPVTRRVYFDVGGSSGLTITPPLLTNSSTLYTPTVSAGGSVVQAPLLTNTSDLFSPTLNPGAVQVAPPLLPSENAFFAPVVSAGGSVVQAPLLTNSSNVFAPTLAAGNVNIAPPVFSNVSVLFEPSVANTGPQTIVAGLFTNTSTLYAPSIGEVAPLTDAEMREMYEKVLAIYAALPSLLTVPKFLALK